MLDMFLVSCPPRELDVAPCAPAVLKGIAEAYNYKVTTYDFNLDFRLNFSEYEDYWFDLGHSNEYRGYQEITKFYDQCMQIIKDNPARWVGISVFSGLSHKFAIELCKKIKQEVPDQKIVLGGRGVNLLSYYPVAFTEFEQMIPLSQVLIKKKLVDQVIAGDAEDAIIDLLSGKLNEISFDKKLLIDNTLKYPFSNFDDYRLNEYTQMGKIQLPVVSSKGCVRQCDFCDVGTHFVKFQSKDGYRLAEELIFLSEKYKIYDFGFLDSIANGNMKALKQACEVLTDYNQSADSDKKITWSGNWICRPPGTVKPEFFDLLKSSGVDTLVVGTEAGSNHVLEMMKKKTTVEGMFYELDQMNRVGIKTMSNQIVGHWSERYVDFLDHVDMLLKFGWYMAQGTLSGLNLGTTFHILDGSPANEYSYSGIDSRGRYEIMWFSDKNPELTIRARLARFLIICQLVKTYNYSQFTADADFHFVFNELTQLRNKWPEFYKKYLAEDFQDTCPSIELRKENLTDFFQSRLATHFPRCTVELVLEASHCNGAPRFYFKHNDDVKIYKELSPGLNTIKFEFDYDYSKNSCVITLGMDNKQLNDTKIDAQGNIVEDKNIALKSLKIDQIELLNQHELMYKNSTYVSNNEISSPIMGFYSNSSISWEFRAPFWTKVLSSIPNRYDYFDANKNFENFISFLSEEIDLIRYN